MAFQLMMALDLDIPVLYLNYGQDNIALHQYASALVLHHEALKRFPNDAENWVYSLILKNIATLYLLDGASDRALPILRTLFANETLLEKMDFFKQQIASYLGLAYVM